ncbi:MAG: hypothetical protein LBM27_00595 [Lactobacillaceae bacterium]|jgi:hypothetical protein|nr:hypothetical protein [Lactobacillaceae bacterium]
MRLFKRMILATVIATGLEVVTPTIVPGFDGGKYILKVSAETLPEASISLTEKQQQTLQNFPQHNVEDIPDLNSMNPDQRQVFMEIIRQTAVNMDLPSAADTEDAFNVLKNIFNSSSDLYLNLTGATTELIDDINENHESPFDSITGEQVLAANHGLIATSILGATFDVVISALVTKGITGGLAALVKKEGINVVKQKLKKELGNKLVSLGLKGLKGLLFTAVDVALSLASPGTSIAKYIDAHDKIKNNGWIELW